MAEVQEADISFELDEGEVEEDGEFDILPPPDVDDDYIDDQDYLENSEHECK